MGAFCCSFCIVLFYFQKEVASSGIISVLLSFFCLMRLANTILQPTTDIFKIVSLSCCRKNNRWYNGFPNRAVAQPGPKRSRDSVYS